MPVYDVFSEANSAAAKARELFEAYVRSGFTDSQAMSLLLAVFGAPIVDTTR